MVDMTYFRVSRVGVEDIREELACTGNASDDESVYVETVDDEELFEVQRIRFRWWR